MRIILTSGGRGAQARRRPALTDAQRWAMEPLWWVVDRLGAAAFRLGGTPTSWIELIGFASGALCVWLVGRQHVANWPIGIVNSLAFLLLFARYGLFADSALQGLYIGMGAYGWWAWVHGDPANSTELAVSRTTAGQWRALAALGVPAVVAMWWVLDVHTPSVVPVWDALTTVLSLLAVWGQARKKLESWWLWIAADVIYVPLYGYKDLWLTTVLYLGFIVLCVRGLRAWRTELEGACETESALA